MPDMADEPNGVIRVCPLDCYGLYVLGVCDDASQHVLIVLRMR